MRKANTSVNLSEQSHKQRDVRFVSDVGQIGPKGTYTGIFPDPISIHFGSPRQNVLKSDPEKVTYLSHYGPI